MRARVAITEDEIPTLLEKCGSPWGSQVELDLIRVEANDNEASPDCLVRIRWVDQTFEFAAECKSRSTPKAIDQAVLEARRFSQATELPPMIIVPYLDARRIDRLADEAVSGIDLSGNGIAIVPGRLLLVRSGRPNRYPDSQPTKYGYRGATSIVPRVFLCQAAFESVGAIRDAIEARGGSVALSTVSKALARMAEDMLIERAGSRITLIQPDVLLDNLRESFRVPSARAITRIRINAAIAELFDRANEKRKRPRLVLSGASSQDRYSVGLRGDKPVAYCERLDEVRDRVGECWEEADRFHDLTVVETTDRTPFFDPRHDPDGVIYASPVQAFLELATGDKRDRQMADQVRKSILRDSRRQQSSPPAE